MQKSWPPGVYETYSALAVRCGGNPQKLLSHYGEPPPKDSRLLGSRSIQKWSQVFWFTKFCCTRHPWILTAKHSQRNEQRNKPLKNRPNHQKDKNFVFQPYIFPGVNLLLVSGRVSISTFNAPLLTTYIPENSRISPLKKKWLVQMYFLLKNSPFLGGHTSFRGCFYYQSVLWWILSWG